MGSVLPWMNPREQPVGFLAAMPEILPLVVNAMPSSVHIVGSRDCDGVVMLAISGPYVEQDKRYVLLVDENGPSRTISLSEVP